MEHAHTGPYKEGMDKWLSAVTSGSTAKGLAKSLEVDGPGLVHYHFPFPPSVSFHV